MENLEHSSVSIVNELIRLTITEKIKWTRCVVNPKEHDFYKPNHDAREINKSLLVRYETEVLGKSVYLGELDGIPKWVVVDGETICRSSDAYLKAYITNPVKSLWRVLEGKAVNDALSVPVTEWLQRLKETNKADSESISIKDKMDKELADEIISNLRRYIHTAFMDENLHHRHAMLRDQIMGIIGMEIDRVTK